MYGASEPTVPGQLHAKVLNLKLSRFYIQIIVQVYGCQVTGISRKAYSLQGLVAFIWLCWPRFGRLPSRAGMPLVESVVD